MKYRRLEESRATFMRALFREILMIFFNYKDGLNIKNKFTDKTVSVIVQHCTQNVILISTTKIYKAINRSFAKSDFIKAMKAIKRSNNLRAVFHAQSCNVYKVNRPCLRVNKRELKRQKTNISRYELHRVHCVVHFMRAKYPQASNVFRNVRRYSKEMCTWFYCHTESFRR